MESAAHTRALFLFVVVGWLSMVSDGSAQVEPPRSPSVEPVVDEASGPDEERRPAVDRLRPPITATYIVPSSRPVPGYACIYTAQRPFRLEFTRSDRRIAYRELGGEDTWLYRLPEEPMADLVLCSLRGMGGRGETMIRHRLSQGAGIRQHGTTWRDLQIVGLTTAELEGLRSTGQKHRSEQHGLEFELFVGESKDSAAHSGGEYSHVLVWWNEEWQLAESILRVAGPPGESPTERGRRRRPMSKIELVAWEPEAREDWLRDLVVQDPTAIECKSHTPNSEREGTEGSSEGRRPGEQR